LALVNCLNVASHPASYTPSLHDALPIFEPAAVALPRYAAAVVFFKPLVAMDDRLAVLPRRTVMDDRIPWRHRDGARGDGDDKAADRKSTRLNSSHVKISYAVFCL